MGTWQLQDAKARLSELIDTAETEGPQIITRRGVKTAVILPFNEWMRRSTPTAPEPPKRILSNEDFLKLLQSAPDFEIPDRHKERQKRRRHRTA
jgi:antitoxin Phd